MLPEPVATRTSFGRYEIVHPLATGGMGTVYLGRMRAARGVSLTVAIKRINAALAGDPRVVGMFVDEARITSLVRHPNVVQTLDVVEEAGELLLVMEYVHGVSLQRLLMAARERGEPLPLDVTARIASDVLYGLHAAHEATNEQGKSLEIVHRDVSPQNILIGVDGIARVADFGIARAANRVETTQLGEIKGKLRYIAPEQFGREAVDRRADIYGVGLLMWEMITGSAMRRASSPGGLTSAILAPRVEPPSSWVRDVPPVLDDIVVRALANDPRDRFPFASQMAAALEAAMATAPYAKVAELVRELGHAEITERKALLERAAALEPISTPAISTSAFPAGPASVPPPLSPAVMPAAAPSSPAVVIRPSAPSGDSPAPEAAKPAARWKSPAIALAVGALALLALTFTIRRPAPPPITAASSEPPPLTSLASPEPAPPPPVEPTASAPAAAPPEAASPAAAHASHWHLRKPPRTLPRRPGKPDCSIPYVVDRNGIRVPRPECM
jgi:serine/threonine-protein kinase